MGKEKERIVYMQKMLLEYSSMQYEHPRVVGVINVSSLACEYI